MTGVAGMIGSHLLDVLLDRGYHVIGLDNFAYGSIENIKHNIPNPQFEFIEGDIMDEGLMHSIALRSDAIIHLAAVKKISDRESSMPTLTVNTRGTEIVLQAAKQKKIKVVFASTSDVYGMSPDLPLNENGDLLLGPSMIKRWSYAVSKLYGEQLCFAYYQDFKLPVVVLRYFGAFSPRSSFSWSGGHIPIFIRQILNDEEVTIHGDGSQTRSMGFVTDLVKGTVLALENEQAIGQLINLGNDEEMSVLDSAKLIHRISGSNKPLKIKFIPMAELFGTYKDIMRRIPDLRKAKEILGYQPSVKLEEAVVHTIQSIRNSQ